MTDMVEKVWRAIAIENGDDPDQIPRHKSHWNKEKGQFGGRFRDINEPFVYGYEAMARAAIRALMEPTEEMIQAGESSADSFPEDHYKAMLKAALDEEKPPAEAEGPSQGGEGS